MPLLLLLFNRSDHEFRVNEGVVRFILWLGTKVFMDERVSIELLVQSDKAFASFVVREYQRENILVLDVRVICHLKFEHFLLALSLL